MSIIAALQVATGQVIAEPIARNDSVTFTAFLHRLSQCIAPAAVRCYYASDPDCTLTAGIALGPVAQCGPCARARSTLGKGTTPAVLPPGPVIDVLDWVAAAGADVRQARRDLAAAVTRARSLGRAWTQIAGRLGITRQAAQQRLSREPGPQA